MKRLGRWAFNILAGLSLTLCIAVAFLFCRVLLDERQSVRMLECGGYALITGGDEIGVEVDGRWLGGVPMGPLVPVFAVLPFWWARDAIRRRRQRRCRAGLWPVCSYDLRATSGRCPECGTVVGREWGK